MAVMKVVWVPDEGLNQVAELVTYKEKNLGQLLLDMEETLLKHEDPPGVGLAAPQVGVRLRIFLAVLSETKRQKNSSTPKLRGTGRKTEKGGIEVFINPRILKMSGSTETSKRQKELLEGCLSLPHYYGPVTRAQEVEIEYETIELSSIQHSESRSQNLKELVNKKKMVYKDFEARIMQHEMDHLDGRLFTSRLLEQGGKLFKEELEDGKQVFVPVEMEM